MGRTDADKHFLAPIDKGVAVLERVPVNLIFATQVPVPVLGVERAHVIQPALGEVLADGLKGD